MPRNDPYQETVNRLIPKLCKLFSEIDIGDVSIDSGITEITVIHPIWGLVLGTQRIGGPVRVSISAASDYRTMASRFAFCSNLTKKDGPLEDPNLQIENSWGVAKILGTQVNTALRDAFKGFSKKVRDLKKSNVDKVRESCVLAIRKEFRSLGDRVQKKYRLTSTEIQELFMEEAKLMPVREVLED